MKQEYDLIPKGMLSQRLAALCDINQTHLYGNTCIQHNHPFLLCTFGEGLSTCKTKIFLIRRKTKTTLHYVLCSNCMHFIESFEITTTVHRNIGYTPNCTHEKRCLPWKCTSMQVFLCVRIILYLIIQQN